MGFDGSWILYNENVLREVKGDWILIREWKLYINIICMKRYAQTRKMSKKKLQTD